MLCFAAELAGPCCRPDLDDLGGGRAATQRRRLSAAEAVGTHTRKATALSSPQWKRKRRQCLRQWKHTHQGKGAVFAALETNTQGKGAVFAAVEAPTRQRRCLSHRHELARPVGVHQRLVAIGGDGELEVGGDPRVPEALVHRHVAGWLWKHRQRRRCLSREGSGDTRQRQYLRRRGWLLRASVEVSAVGLWRRRRCGHGRRRQRHRDEAVDGIGPLEIRILLLGGSIIRLVGIELQNWQLQPL